MFNSGILTISDKGSHGQRYDKSGEVISNSLSVLNSHVVKYEVIPDEALRLARGVLYREDLTRQHQDK